MCLLNHLFRIDIYITSITKKIPFQDISKGIMNMNPLFDEEQVVLNLQRFLPGTEEIAKLVPYKTAPAEVLQQLSLPDKFCLEVV